MFDLSRIVAIFQDDKNPETIGVGITDETGDELVLSVHEPDIIVGMAQRLVTLADEIQQNRDRNINKVIAQLEALGPDATMGDLAAHNKRLHDAGVVSLDSKRSK